MSTLALGPLLATWWEATFVACPHWLSDLCWPTWWDVINICCCCSTTGQHSSKNYREFFCRCSDNQFKLCPRLRSSNQAIFANPTEMKVDKNAIFGNLQNQVALGGG